jgi:hypothetical protein
MKKSALILTIIIAVLLLLGIYLFNSARPVAEGLPAVPGTPVSHKEDPSRPSKPLTHEESQKAQASLKQMTQVLLSYTVSEKKLAELMVALKQDQQEPFQVKDKNPDTGEMIIVRTKSPPPGTRYFHAQYFTDENNQSFAQHMSFEFRPSPEAMEQAIQTVQETFSGLGAPMEERRDFIQWELPNGYVVWVKRLDQEDISNNPFNAYTPGDIGSIRIAVELNPESDAPHSH